MHDVMTFIKNHRLWVGVGVVFVIVLLVLFIWKPSSGGSQVATEPSYADLTAVSEKPSSASSSVASAETGQSGKEGKITVDVKGAVVAPGVYTLDKGSRVTDAIKAAGGMTAEADSKSVNLATSLADESVIYVATQGENISVVSPSAGQATSEGKTAGDQMAKLNINTATVEEFQTISGIGAKKAADIVAYRDSHGPFQSVDDLTKVSGIGEKTLERMRGNLYVA